AEWVDPSASLDWRTRERLQHELLAPVLAKVEDNFVYRGSARDYFVRAIKDQVRLSQPRPRMHSLDRYYAWLRYTGFRDKAEREREEDQVLAKLARTRRRAWRSIVAERARIAEDAPILDVIEAVPRERYAPVDRVAESTRDQAVPLDATG